MSCYRFDWVAGILLGVVVCAGDSHAADAKGRIVFNRDIRPIFSENCLTCHGPSQSQRQAGLRLDIKDGAFGELESGAGVAIVAGDLQQSQLYQRVTTDDESLRMPPADSGHELTEREIDLLRQWIEEGAVWQEHWSFITPKRPPLPAVQETAWPKTAIDHFVLAKLEAEGLGPSPPADKETLIRRVTYDLTGLPPTLAEIDAFLADTSPDAYKKVVDGLLKSPRYGEHMARYWLDVARYGDTHGLHLDNKRSIWPYRDWVIRAFNNNMPFDQFTIQQLAGDLLPDPTLSQRIATGFNRCNVTTSEGGAIAEEFRVRYAIDRVETTATAWLGLTLGCAVCHEHKYDPISQEEFYQLYAFFNSLTDRGMDGNALLPPPSVQVPAPQQARKQQALREQIAELEGRITRQLADIQYEDPQPDARRAEPETWEFVWIEDALPSGAKPSGDGANPWQFVSGEEHPVFSGRTATTRASSGRSQHYFTGAKPGLQVGQGDTLFAYVYLDPQNPPREIMLQFNDGSWEHRAFWGEDLINWGHKGTSSRLPLGPLPDARGKWVRLEVDAAAVGLKPGAVLNGWAFTQFGGRVYWDKAGIVTRTPQNGQGFESLARWERLQRSLKNPDLPTPVLAAIKVDPGQRNDRQRKQVRDYFLRKVYPKSRKTIAPLERQLADVKKQLETLEKSIPSTLVTEERDQPRETFVLIRGAYDKPGQKVEHAVPDILPPLPTGAPRNRLGLARWLVNPSHPLTARVTVNRFWQRFFGTGLVKTTEDFGTRGEWPSHPQLLDWLAREFIESGWDVKHMQRLIATSAVYRQSSRLTPQLLARDPDNRLLARGPRFRMDAEMIRDTALAVGGLLAEQIGGESVKPYQPAGLWKTVGYTTSNTAVFKQDHGRDLYRRSMYTFWKRTSPPPSMRIFDAPSREACTVKRERTNTPLQALTLMNDVQFVEAARNLAGRVMTESGLSEPGRVAPDRADTARLSERATFAFRLATARRPRPEELRQLVGLYRESLAEFQRETEAAVELISVGESKRDESLPPAELAAWTIVANLVLNLDETVTKR